MKPSRKGVIGGRYKPLSEESVEKVHETAMRLIEEVGFEVNSETALGLFHKAGAQVNRERRLVRLPREKTIELINTAPSEVRLCGQEDKHDILLGGSRVYAGTGGTALNIYEPDTNQKRLATLEDLRRIAKLVDQLDNIHLFMLATYPNELPVEQVDVNRFFAGLDNSTKHIMGGVYTAEGVKQVVRMAEIVAGSAEALRERPIISMIACSMSPMKLDAHYGDLVVVIAESGIPLVCPAEPLCGATSPVTLAGNLVIQTVDSLMGVMLTQIVNPGTPVIFGSVATSTDLTNLGYLAGSIEMGLINAAGAQMAQFYKLPFYATGGMTDSKVLDSQSGYESALTGLLCALAGSNFIHDAAGLMEFAMTVCYEKLVIDNEILGMVMRAVEGIRVDDETLAFDLIKQVGPGGNFTTAKHTRRFMRTEHYLPTLSDRDSRADWERKGSKVTWQKAGEIARELIADSNHRLPETVRRQILTEIKGIVD
ncbi:MAG: trimethylamine methyltransferase family protein [Dehalococcoidales bacterium]|nr:MAG: trimethylamine methyltransferase family protein [Dehalococcoidales bacterium]